MSRCINTASNEFKALTEMSGLNSMELEAKMNVWMDDNNTDVWPTLEQLGLKDKSIKDSILELFESNPKLINSIYSVLGFDLPKINMNPIFPKKHWSIGHVIDTPEDANRICQITQMKVFSYLSENFKQNDGKEVAKPVMIWAKSPLNNSQIFHWTVVVKINGKLYLYDMPQSEFIERIDDNSGRVISEYKPRLIEYTLNNFKKFYGATDKSAEINISDEDLIDEVPEFPLNKITDREKLHAEDMFFQYVTTTFKKDIDGFKKFIEENKVESKEISDTTTAEDNFMANFQEPQEDFERPTETDEFENKNALTDEEKNSGAKISFAALTSNLVYQKNDTSNEWTNINGKIAKANKEEIVKLKQERAKIIQRFELLKEKIKQANQMSNLEQIIEFGNDAYNEVVDLLNSDKVTDKQLNYCKRIVDFWIKAGDFGRDRAEHILFGEDPLSKLDESLNIPERLAEIAHRMSILDNSMKKMEIDLITKEAKKQLSGNYTAKDIYRPMNDIGWWEMNAFGISDYGSPLLSAMYATMHEADTMAAKEFEAIIKNIDEKFKAADKFLQGKGDEKYKLFYQEQNGQLTGDLVKVYSKEYTDKKAELLEKAQATNKAEDWKAFKDWSKENEDYIDIRLLFPEGELSNGQKELAEKHKKDIISKIGQQQFDKIYSRLENIIEDYNYAKNQEKLRLMAEDSLSEAEKTFELNVWEHLNSPYIELDRRIGNLSTGSTYVSLGGNVTYAKKGIRGLMSVAKEKYSDGKSTGWYDTKYKKIADNKETFELYNYLQEIMEYMRSILPEHLRNHVGSNTMPLIMKSMTDLFSQNSALGMANLWSSLQKSNLVGDISDTEFDEINVISGIKEGGLKPQTFMHSNQVINDRIKIKSIEFEAINGVEPSKKDLVQIKKDVINQLNLERSFDLPKVIKMYVGNMITHKHKSNVDDLIKIGRRALDEISEISMSDAGTEQFTVDGKLRVQEGLKKTKEALDYAIKAFEGGQLHKPEGRVLEKKLTYLEKKELADLLSIKDKLQIQLDNGKITKEKFIEDVAIIDNKIEKLGGYVYLSKVGDNLLKYTQLKGMGLNFIAGGVNLLTGWMENSIRAADGRWFNETQLNQGLKDAYSSIFDPFGKSKTTRKLIGIEKFFHLVEDASQELYQHKDKFTEGAFIVTKKTEFINVMSMAGAFLRNVPVKNDKGEVSNLFEAFDENGNIKDGWKLSDSKTNEQFLLDVDLRMRKIKHKIHGNYGDRLKGKETIFGRMAFQFRTWMPEMYNARFGKAQPDPILQKEIKGRWRSLGTILGSEFQGNQFTAADNILHTLKQLGRKVLFMRTSFDGRMSESDAANMKANLMELHFMLGLMALMLILKAAVPDEDKKNNFTYNFLINMAIRQQNDIMVFANPMTFEQINKNVLPVMGVLSDTESLVKSIKNEFSEDERKSGKSLARLAKMVPPFGQAVRVYQYGEKVVAQQ